MTTDTSEKGLETLIIRHMTGVDGLAVIPASVAVKPDPAGIGYYAGSPKDYDRAHALDVSQLFAFLSTTQPEAFKKLAMSDDPKDINRLKFLARLAEETDPNNLHDLKAALDAAQVYSPDQVRQVVELFLGGADRDKLDPILDACVADYVNRLDEDGQVDFKGKAKAFCRTYSFLSSVIPYSNVEWEKLSILLSLLTPKLPAPREEDLAKGILDAIDMDSYRVEKKAAMNIALADKDAEIDPVPTAAGGYKPEPELDRLSNILTTFNERFGTLFTDTDRVARRIRDDIAPKVAADAGYQNAKENTPHTARLAHDQALGKVMQHLLKEDTQVYKEFVENESFKRFVSDMVYVLTSQE